MKNKAPNSRIERIQQLTLFNVIPKRHERNNNKLLEPGDVHES